MDPRLDYLKHAPKMLQAIYQAHLSIDDAGLEKDLLHLVKLRASQINGCAHCIELHSREARNEGETEQRLYLLSAWRDSFLYSKREELALAWTEAMTKMDEGAHDDALFDEVHGEFGDEGIVVLMGVIGMINMWNRFSVGFRAVHKGPEA